MLLTLAPLRTKLAEDEKYSEWYNGIKAKIYGRCGHKDEPGRIGNGGIMGMQYHAPR